MKRALVVVVIGLALGACGGDGEESIPKDDYLERARVICREGNEDLAEATQEAFKDVKQGEQPTAEQLETYAKDVVVPKVRQQVEDLRNLPDPKDAADQVEEIYDSFEKTLDRIDAQPSLLTDNPNLSELFKEADDLSRKYGFPVCT
ncbi:MAG: hypothetical protein ACRDZ3_20190 [Acidimicrobiia bacterium]